MILLSHGLRKKPSLPVLSLLLETHVAFAKLVFFFNVNKTSYIF